MRNFSLDTLRTTLKKADERSSRNNFQSNYYPYYQLKPGEFAKVRFLPDLNEENPYEFFVEKYMHPLEINGEEKKIPCLTMHSTDKDVCPICNLSKRLYKAGDKVTGKIYWKRMSRIAQVLVIDDPLAADEETGENYVGKVKLLNIGFQLFNVIREGLGSEDFDEVPFAFKGGTDFTIKKTEGQGGYATYTVGSKFARKASDIDEDMVLEHMVDLSTVLPNKPDLKEVEKLLKAAQSGGVIDDEDEDETEDSEDEVETPKSAGRSPSKGKAKAVVEDDEQEEITEDEDLDDEEEAVLEQIRARRNTRK